MRDRQIATTVQVSLVQVTKFMVEGDIYPLDDTDELDAQGRRPHLVDTDAPKVLL